MVSRQKFRTFNSTKRKKKRKNDSNKNVVGMSRQQPVKICTQKTISISFVGNQRTDSFKKKTIFFITANRLQYHSEVLWPKHEDGRIRHLVNQYSSFFEHRYYCLFKTKRFSVFEDVIYLSLGFSSE